MAAALVGGAFLSASLQVIFDRIASPGLVNLFRSSPKKDEMLLQKLEDTLLTIHVVLNDADNKQFTDPSVKKWLDELQYVVSLADDLVDEIATRGAMKLEADAEEKTITTRLFKLMPFSTDPFRKEMDSRLEKIVERLDYFAKHKDVLGLKQVSGRQFMSSRLPSTSLVGETRVYGRHDDQEKIVKLLVSDEASDNQISVVPIVGMGGIGKTTLAQMVYNDKIVDEYFNKKAWVCVSDPFDVFVVTKTILEAVTSSTSDIKDDLNRLQEKLYWSLNQQKFMLILDDVWTESSDDWDLFRSPLRSVSHGSKVIVTTRNSGVASMVQTVPFHRAKELSDEDCWSLFAERAFENQDPSRYPNLGVIGKEIVRKCGGLPLAAKTLGGPLRSKVDVEEWEYICKSQIWDLPPNKSKIIPSLMLSYQDLPSHLKRCFAYCSTFPKDYVFQKEKLVLQWMAHNLVPQQSNSQMMLEEIGDLCFRELLSRSFFQQSFYEESRFVMHDLIHDLAQLVSGGQFSSLDERKPLRSFLEFTPRSLFGSKYWSRNTLHETLPKLRCLRVLCLTVYSVNEFSLPDSIANLIHLRYLDVSNTDIKVLPESITTLYNLQTLLLSYCHNLTKLPQNLRRLSFLRQLELRGSRRLKEMPAGMHQLKSLQFLSTFVVGNNIVSRINALGKLDNLRERLSILRLENVMNSDDALDANIKGKKHLETLEFEWSTCTDNFQQELDVLDNLQPHNNVKNLIIKNYGGEAFPRWLGGNLYHNMISLILEGCENCLILPQLGQLPSLKFLTIERMKQIVVVGPEFYGDDSISKPFQSLKTLEFHKMGEWEKWHTLDSRDFACLEELSIVDCPKLTTELPNRVGSLRRLEICRCHQLMASNQIVKLLEQCISSLQTLIIPDIPTLAEPPRQLSNLTNLHELEISKCIALESFPDTGLPIGLRVLRIEGCDALKSFPSCGLPTTLEKLKIQGCRNLELLNDMENCYASIKHFTLCESCESLKFFPLSLFPNILKLQIVSCRNIETISVINIADNHNIRLQTVLIWSCPNLIWISLGGLAAPDLHTFDISNCKNVKTLSSLSLPLKHLYINNCPKLECLTEGCLPSSLEDLSIFNCQKLMGSRKEWGLQALSSLTCVYISGEFIKEDECKTFPEEWFLPSSLQDLYICNFPNLEVLNHKGIQNLTSLTYLAIYNCPRLESLSKEILPTSIAHLILRDYSPLLKQRMQKDKGEEWPYISHIPCIKLDDNVLQ